MFERLRTRLPWVPDNGEGTDYEAMAEATRRAGYGHLLGMKCSGPPVPFAYCACMTLSLTSRDNHQGKAECGSCRKERLESLSEEQPAPRRTNTAAVAVAAVLFFVTVAWLGTSLTRAGEVNRPYYDMRAS